MAESQYEPHTGVPIEDPGGSVQGVPIEDSGSEQTGVPIEDAGSPVQGGPIEDPGSAAGWEGPIPIEPEAQ